MARHNKEIFELLIKESPHVLFLQEARTTPHELRAMKHRFREVVYFVLWDARHQLACIARHGLNLSQIRGPDWVTMLFNCVIPECFRDMFTTRLRARLKGPA